MDVQQHLFEIVGEQPSTRYQGSKLKLTPWIWKNLADLDFHTVLDVFGGTGSVSYLLKARKKAVTYNDYLRFNQVIGAAIIENSTVRLSDEEILFVLERHSDISYDDFIESTFRDVYFTDQENAWLDTVCQNIPLLDGKKQALAYYALFQSCIIKRPYNLFHRKNLYIRTARVERSFGNKATWDTPFREHFIAFAKEVNRAVFDSGVPCFSICFDAHSVPGKYDLVYIDPPYVNKNGVGVDYLAFYHFLEGMVDYRTWGQRIDRSKKHLPLIQERSPWSDQRRTKEAFQELFQRYSDSILVVSYRSDGIPSEQELVKLLGSVKRKVSCTHFGEYKYVLSTKKDSKEILLVGR